MVDTTPRRLLGTPQEVAAYLRLSEKTLAQMRYQRRGPRYSKAGGAVRYRWSDVDSWLDHSGSGDAA